VTETEIAELRSRIAELEEGDEDFARKSNLLLDEILLTREQADKNTVAIENLVQVTSESRRDIDQLATRMGELAQSVSELRQNQQLLTFTVTQVAESITILRQSQQTFVETFARFTEQAALDRQSFQAEIQRIWEYLLSTRPNGRGEQGGEG
jgi:chromosome segregation ATPase